MTLFVMRLLQPTDYGLMALVMAVVGFLQTMSSTGVCAALVQAHELDETMQRKAFGLVLLVNLALLLALYAAAYPVAEFYRQPELVPLLHVGSVSFLLMALGTVPQASLDRRMSLARSSQIDAASNIMGGLAVMALAWSGWGVWALLTGMLVGLTLRTAGVFVASPFRRWPLFSLDGIQGLVRFGGWRTADFIVWYLGSQVDVFIAGRLLGEGALGIYSVGRTIAALPVTKLAQVINPITLSAFARLQDDRRLAYQYLVRASRLLGFLSFPVFFGLAAVAPEFVSVVLGARWTDAAMPLAILAIGLAPRPIGLILPPFISGMGEPRFQFHNSLIGLALFTVFYAVGSHWGVLGLCVGGTLAYPCQFVLLVRRVSRLAGEPVRHLLAALAPSLLCAALIFPAVAATRVFTAGLVQPALQLPLLIVAGIIVYVAGALVLCRPVLADILSLLPGSASRMRQRPA
jgi:O-antigen/teichoic acid export membrane protein